MRYILLIREHDAFVVLGALLIGVYCCWIYGLYYCWLFYADHPQKKFTKKFHARRMGKKCDRKSLSYEKGYRAESLFHIARPNCYFGRVFFWSRLQFIKSMLSASLSSSVLFVGCKYSREEILAKAIFFSSSVFLILSTLSTTTTTTTTTKKREKAHEETLHIRCVSKKPSCDSFK